MYVMSYANNKGADQPAHMRSLISAFVVRCLDSISLDSIAKISTLAASVVEQASSSLTWTETPEDTFCHVVAHLRIIEIYFTSIFCVPVIGYFEICKLSRDCQLYYLLSFNFSLSLTICCTVLPA